MTDERDKGIVEINGKEYVICPEGAFIDLDGNLCGFLCGDIVHECQMEEEGDNLVDTIVSTAEKKKAGEGTKAALVELVVITAVAITAIIGVVNARKQGREQVRDAEAEADEAEARAADMQRRLDERRRKN
jgi:6-phosphogluconate dehydrogenase